MVEWCLVEWLLRKGRTSTTCVSVGAVGWWLGGGWAVVERWLGWCYGGVRVVVGCCLVGLGLGVVFRYGIQVWLNDICVWLSIIWVVVEW